MATSKNRRIKTNQVPDNNERPALTPKTSLDDFRNHYWYLTELVSFCRDHDLDPSGQKLELVDRIEGFLKTGRVKSKPAKAASSSKPAKTRRGPIRLDTPVTKQFKCDAETRAFFKSAIGEHFHFTAHVQQFRRERQRKGLPLTYGDLVREWQAEYERRKDPNYKSKVLSSWEYNRFVRDFMTDKKRNAGKGISEAAKAWNTIRVRRGKRTYHEYLRLAVGRG
jgi:hypothetical protein